MPLSTACIVSAIQQTTHAKGKQSAHHRQGGENNKKIKCATTGSSYFCSRLWVQAVRVRGQVAAEATVGGPNQGECEDPVRQLVRAVPEAQHQKLLREALRHIDWLQGIELQRNHAALADRLGHRAVCTRLERNTRDSCTKHLLNNFNLPFA